MAHHHNFFKIGARPAEYTIDFDQFKDTVTQQILQMFKAEEMKKKDKNGFF